MSSWVAHRRTFRVFFLSGKRRLEPELRPFWSARWAQHQSLSFRPLPALHRSLYRSLTQCFVTSTMENRLRTASSQGKTDVLAWMSWGVNLWSVGFPAKGKQPRASVEPLISKDGSCFLCLTASGACSCKEKKEQCMFYWLNIVPMMMKTIFSCISLSLTSCVRVTDCKSPAACNEMPMKWALFCSWTCRTAHWRAAGMMNVEGEFCSFAFLFCLGAAISRTANRRCSGY